MHEPTTIDVAAGGLLEAAESDGVRIAVIHRSRYDDWTLPKGHLEAGETLEQAAVREVEEETGCRGEIAEIVQPIAYLVRGQPKIVVFYRMQLAVRGEFTPDDEVSAVEWMTPDAAMRRLTHRDERNLVSKAYSL